jgi:hypothetical protein
MLWLIIFASMHILQRKALSLARRQNFVVFESPAGMNKEPSLRLIVVQIILAAAIFALSAMGGAAVFSFCAGGWIVMTTASVGLMIRSSLYLRALSQAGAAAGAIKLSNYLANSDKAYQIFGTATFCLMLGLLLANLALLGGALFSFATAIGYLRRAKGKFIIEL